MVHNLCGSSEALELAGDETMPDIYDILEVLILQSPGLYSYMWLLVSATEHILPPGCEEIQVIYSWGSQGDLPE